MTPFILSAAEMAAPDSASFLLYPVRCYCGKPIGQLQATLEALQPTGTPMGQILDMLGLRRQCCRSAMMSPSVHHFDVSSRTLIQGQLAISAIPPPSPGGLPWSETCPVCRASLDRDAFEAARAAGARPEDAFVRGRAARACCRAALGGSRETGENFVQNVPPPMPAQDVLRSMRTDVTRQVPLAGAGPAPSTSGRLPPAPSGVPSLRLGSDPAGPPAPRAAPKPPPRLAARLPPRFTAARSPPPSGAAPGPVLPDAELETIGSALAPLPAAGLPAPPRYAGIPSVVPLAAATQHVAVGGGESTPVLAPRTYLAV